MNVHKIGKTELNRVRACKFTRQLRNGNDKQRRYYFAGAA